MNTYIIYIHQAIKSALKYRKINKFKINRFTLSLILGIPTYETISAFYGYFGEIEVDGFKHCVIPRNLKVFDLIH